MKIREARKDDALLLSEIAVEAVTPHRHVDFTDEGWALFLTATSPRATQSRLDDPRYRCFCAEHEKNIAGFITIMAGEKIDQLFVRPDAQRRGVAGQLWEYARVACALSDETTGYWVRSSTMAIPFYRRLGFTVCGEIVVENGITHHLMRMTVSPKN